MPRPTQTTESAPSTPTHTKLEPLVYTPIEDTSVIAPPSDSPERANRVPQRSSTTPVNGNIVSATPKPTSASHDNLAPGSAASASASRSRHGSDASVETSLQGGADSIFRLLPRESRNAIRRMMFIEPSARCTLSDLLHGTGKSSGLVCGCGGVECGGGLNTPPNEDVTEGEEGDDGDEWLKNIRVCSSEQGQAGHSHTMAMAEEKQHKRKFFH